ncbi:MAG: hypothetical protein IPO27_01830 [Bacteroidetes bacterium]|nr:hypothetical protein [Bacteroidota bacterium]
MNKFDNLFLGILVGLLMPLIGAVFFKITFWGDASFTSILPVLLEHRMLSPFISLSLLLNGGAFYLFLHKDMEHSARGVLLSTFMYALVVIYFKFF